jgi:hypothetical protein
MSVRNSLRLLAAYYRKSARLAVFVILLASFAVPAVLASPPGSVSLSPNVSVNAVQPFGCGLPFFPSNGYYQASGGVSASGTYSGNVYLTGSITVYGHDKATDKPETETLALTQGDFSPTPMSFPGQSQSGVDNPQVNSNFCERVIDGYTYWVAASSQSGCFTGACLLANETVTVSVTNGNTQMFQLIMEMPLFNETTLGTTVHCAPTTAPCGLPLQGFYDFVFIIAIILAGGGFLVALANKQLSGDEREKSENISNLAAYLFTAKEFTKPVIDSIFSDYSRLFEYSRSVLDFQKAQKICGDSSSASFARVLEQVPRPETDFFANFVRMVELQLGEFSVMKLESWLEPTALAVATAFLVTKEDVFLADVACRRSAANSRSVKILYEHSWINDDEQHKPPTDRTTFSVAIQRAIDGSNPRTEYLGDFQRGLASGFLFRRISEIPITRLHRIEDKVSKALTEMDFEKRLTAHLQALKRFLQSELRSSIIIESLRMQLVTAYAITVPTPADVISGVIKPLLPKVCEELAANEPSYKDLFIEDEATQPKIGKYTRLGVVPYGMNFSTFSQKMACLPNCH